MNQFLRTVESFAESTPEARAFMNSCDEAITYRELKDYSDNLAAWLAGIANTRSPIVVYGHKSPFMLVSFFACLKSGHAYVPIDINLPESRITNILEQLDRPILLNTRGGSNPAFAAFLSHQVGFDELRRRALRRSDKGDPAPLEAVRDDENFYIMFTSGSTGSPKGVEITASCVDHFFAWIAAEFPSSPPQVFFNRAPFSFDLSVTDFVLGLGTGNILFALESADEVDLAKTFGALKRAMPTFWVSTASFAEVCLRDPKFSPELLPQLKTFFFVGETLKNETAGALLKRFCGCEVINGYGPTESTDLVTSVRITPAMVASPNPLPVGRPKPGTTLKVLHPDTLDEQPPGQVGELFIIGDTVARGYFRRPDLTEAAFHSCPSHLCGDARSYRTGDSVIVDEEGMLHFCGRLDFQIKLHGYRIELGDVEENLRKVARVQDACVLPVLRNQTVSHLAAYVLLAEGVSERGFELTQAIKDSLRQIVPEYMVPRKFVYVEAFPLNTNGKIDRDRLRGAS
jgi:D-alanine--poly(phosphoribitol) ligase subunit 1